MGEPAWIREILSHLQSNSQASGDTRIEGCSEAEVDRIGLAQGVACPPEYRDLMRAVGRHAGGLMAGSDWLFPEPIGLKADARQLLAEQSDAPELPDGSLVFLMHQGYLFWFLAGPPDGEDRCAAVFLYKEGAARMIKVADSLPEFVLARCASEKQVRIDRTEDIRA